MTRLAISDLRRMAGDERGTVALTFGLSSIVLCLMAGLAIDVGKTVHASQKITSSIDAATLAAAKGLRLEGLSESQAIALATNMFQTNMANTGKFATITKIEVNVDVAKSLVEMKVDADVETSFGGIAGVPKFEINRTSVAIFEAKDIEVGLQLDVTGSMGALSGSGGTKIADLRTATKELIDILLPDTPTGQKIRIGFAPFASGVNAGPYFAAVNGNRAGDGCVYERINIATQSSDVSPAGTNALKIKSDLAGAGACPSNPVLALTDNKSLLKSRANALTTSTATAGHLGTAWAWYLLAPHWSSVWGLAQPAANYNDGKTVKVAILMTDGEYNTIGGVMSGGNVVTSSQMAEDTCSAMKAKGIVVYTVGFKLTVPLAIDTLRDCASSPSQALRAENGDELSAAFRDIADQIMSLRLSK